MILKGTFQPKLLYISMILSAPCETMQQFDSMLAFLGQHGAEGDVV